MSDKENEVRALLFEANVERLCELAQRAQNRGMTARTGCVVCIDVDDTKWKELVERFMPGNEAEWNAWRAKGMKPVARGSVYREGLAEYLRAVCPAVGPVFDRTDPDGGFYAIVCADGGASVYIVRPKAEAH